MQMLGKLFGSAARVKLLRLFIFNPETSFSAAAAAKRVRATAPTVRRELAGLLAAGVLKRRSYFEAVERKRGKKIIKRKKRVAGYVLNPSFPYLEALREFLVETVPIEAKEVLRRLRGVGRLKLVVVAGVFIRTWDSRVDLLIVADSVQRPALEAAVKALEAELGIELRFAVLSSHDFRYRLSVYDRLVRDVLDFPHETLLDRIGVYRPRNSAES